MRINQSGQTLVIIVLVMMMALAVGTAVSSRFIKSISERVQTDSSVRALAVAEAAIERLLRLPDSTLQDYVKYGTCGSDCELEIVGGDGVVAKTTVVLGNVGGSSDILNVSLTTDSVVEVGLDGFNNNTDISVCWNNPSGIKPSVAGILIYGGDDSLGVDNYAFNSIGSTNIDNGFDDAASVSGYENCFEAVGRTNPRLLRLKSYYNNVDAVVLPGNGASLPIQGILIEATGKVADAVKKVSVIRSNKFLPVQFDFAVFNKSATFPLSNSP
ncbi:hypothetical protein HYW61_00095 [candidate division WWE3 bacterium]|nr:hypothetical protein [candidate division WWE3 bacterium]